MFSKKDLVDLIKRTPRENAGKLSFDYSLPTPDRDFGETRGGKPKWTFDFKKRGGLAGWIQRAKDFQDMRDAEGKIVSFKKGLLPGDVFEERLSDADKERAKQARQAEKIALLQQLVGGEQQAGLLRPIPSRPGSILSMPSSPGAFSPFRESQISFLSEDVREPIQIFDEATNPQGFGSIPLPGGVYDKMIEEQIIASGYEPNEGFIEVVRNEATRKNIPIDDAIKNILQYKPVDVEFKPIQRAQTVKVEPEPSGSASGSAVNWNDKKIRADIGFALDNAGYRGTEANKNIIIQWFNLNPQKIPSTITTSTVKQALAGVSLDSFGLEKKR